MKAKTTLAVILAVQFLTSCDQQKRIDSPEMLKGILTEYFDGIKNRDINKMNTVTSSDFILYEDGKVWTNDSLINFLDQFESFKGTWKFDNMKVNIDRSSADIVYTNHGDLVFNDTIKMQFDWLESATFRKIDGEWKINFLHSTARK